MMANIKGIADNYLCSACGACTVVCPQDAISFDWTSVGRKYAVVNEKLCTRCGLCMKVCPSVDVLNLYERYEDHFVGKILDTYTGISANNDIFRNAQSGGLCTATVSYLFESGAIDAAVMCQMSAGLVPLVQAILITDPKQLAECQKSCYSPVDVLSALKLADGKRSVAIVGLPCHIEAATLMSEQFKSFSNITYKLGLICDRTHCRGMQDVLSSLGGNAKKRYLNWKKKDFTFNGQYYDYKSSPVVILDEKREICKNGILSNESRFALKDMFTAPRCRVCYDKLNIHSDLVFGDPWGMTDIDWQRGESLLLARTGKGRALIEEMISHRKVLLRKRDNYEDVITGQHIDEKRKYNESYVRDFNRFFDSSLSYLSKFKATSSLEATHMVEFRQFVELERKSYNTVCKIALSRLGRQCSSSNLLPRILRKVRELIKMAYNKILR